MIEFTQKEQLAFNDIFKSEYSDQHISAKEQKFMTQYEGNTSSSYGSDLNKEEFETR